VLFRLSFRLNIVFCWFPYRLFFVVVAHYVCSSNVLRLGLMVRLPGSFLFGSGSERFLVSCGFGSATYGFLRFPIPLVLGSFLIAFVCSSGFVSGFGSSTFGSLILVLPFVAVSCLFCFFSVSLFGFLLRLAVGLFPRFIQPPH